MAYKNIEDARAASKRNYYENKERYLERNRKRAAAFRAYIDDLRAITPCTDCGVLYPHYVMDFDHLRDKTFNVSQLNKIHSMDKLKLEISKCEIVCSNCHRVRTFKRRHNISL